ncbi:MAG: heme-copper oxidase subunit III [Sphingobacteriaceae bacterium]|nr:MAG: heme-copper oxidase subunit III [Sphingobacteriaceae bacterium]
MGNKLMMKLVIGTEAMFFVSLMMAFVYFSFGTGFKAQLLHNLDVKATAIFTVMLFLSSFTYWRAEVNYKKNNLKRLKFWLIFTLVLGIVFLLGQGREYAGLLHANVTISSSSFGTSFFTLTGFHGLHVLIGLIVISVITFLAFAGDYNKPHSTVISTVGLYWHFVDIVWAFVFLLVYILPHLI